MIPDKIKIADLIDQPELHATSFYKVSSLKDSQDIMMIDQQSIFIKMSSKNLTLSQCQN